MELSFEEYKAKIKQFNKITTDEERLKFLQENTEYFKVILDNDATMVMPKSKEIQEQLEAYDISMNDFDEYHYRSEGNIILFRFIGIEAEFC